MTTPPISYPLPAEWWDDHHNIVDLLDYLHAQGFVETDDIEIIVAEPWRFDEAYWAMRRAGR